MAYVIPPTSHELLQQLLDEIKGLREDLKPKFLSSAERVAYEQGLREDFRMGIIGSLEITPEQTSEIVRQVQVKLLQQAKRSHWGGKGSVYESEQDTFKRWRQNRENPDE